MMKDIIDEEEKLIRNLGDMSIKLLNKAIIDIDKCSDEELVFEVVHIQIVIELMLKYYVSLKYGFLNVLDKKQKKLRMELSRDYLNNLRSNSIHTLGYRQLIKFLEDKSDTFGIVVKEGIIPFHVVEYDYLEDTFEKFQNIRNNFVHIGVSIDKSTNRWIRDEFHEVVLIFLSSVLRKIDYMSGRSNICIVDKEEIDDAPMDVLRRSLSFKALQCLQKNDYILKRLNEIAYDASDLDGIYNCRKCGKETLVLNFFFSEGVSKCFYCGDFFTAGYTDCSLCGGSRTVTYDSLNIEYNQNIMSGYCYDCESRVKVYKCPICGMVHTYSRSGTLNKDNDECCINSFKDRYVM